MPELALKGSLKLVGKLKLKGASNGKVTVDGAEALVELSPSGPSHATASPVMMPPPPAGPSDPGPDVWVITSFSKEITANGKIIVAGGMAMQGKTPTWPGMVLPSQKKVTANGIPINVKDDQAMIFPSGSSVKLSSSGQ